MLDTAKLPPLSPGIRYPRTLAQNGSVFPASHVTAIQSVQNFPYPLEDNGVGTSAIPTAYTPFHL